MEVTSAGPITVPTSSSSISSASAIAKAEAKEQVSGVRRIDFSHITPRQLNAYLDEMIFSNQIDLLDAGVLMGAIPTEAFEQSPDAPVNLKAGLEGTMKYYQNHGNTLLATWYAGLMDRLETMERQSIHVSVYA